MDKPRKCTIILGVIYFLLLVADLATDWLFYYDVKTVEKGLVFGPVDTNVVQAVFVFTVVSSVTFLKELYSFKGMISDEEQAPCGCCCCHPGQAIDVGIIFFKDIPIALLVVLMSLCRPDPNSQIQLAKAILMLITLVVKTVLTIYFTCRNKTGSKILTALAILLTAVEFIIMIFVFIALTYEITEDGKLKWTKPNTVFEDTYKENRLFTDVSIFMHDPNALLFSPEGQPGDPSNAGWLRLASINQIKRSSKLEICVEYHNVNTAPGRGYTLLMLRNRQPDGAKSWETVGRYNISSDGFAVEINSSSFHIPRPSSVIDLNFTYEKATGFFKKRPMGDITFKAFYQDNHEDRSVVFLQSIGDSVNDYANVNTRTSTSEPNTHNTEEKKPIVLHYFNHRPLQQDEHPVFSRLANGSTAVFRESRGDVNDVLNIWVTGWNKCPTTGNLGPRWLPVQKNLS